jgi:hypothetical protein
VALPVSSERLIIESSNQAQSRRTRNFDNILPLLIPLENIFGQLANVSLKVPMLEDLPHTVFSIYILFSMSRQGVSTAA